MGDDPRHEVTKDRKAGVPPHQPDLDDEAKDRADEMAEESFPSSDPPSTGSPGAGAG